MLPARCGDIVVQIATSIQVVMSKLEDVESHFAFGENWAAYAAGIGDEEIREAEKGLLNSS